MLFGGRAVWKRSQVAPLASRFVLLARIEPVLAGFQLADHQLFLCSITVCGIETFLAGSSIHTVRRIASKVGEVDVRACDGRPRGGSAVSLPIGSVRGGKRIDRHSRFDQHHRHTLTNGIGYARGVGDEPLSGRIETELAARCGANHDVEPFRLHRITVACRPLRRPDRGRSAEAGRGGQRDRPVRALRAGPAWPRRRMAPPVPSR